MNNGWCPKTTGCRVRFVKTKRGNARLRPTETLPHVGSLPSQVIEAIIKVRWNPEVIIHYLIDRIAFGAIVRKEDDYRFSIRIPFLQASQKTTDVKIHILDHRGIGAHAFQLNLPPCRQQPFPVLDGPVPD